MSSCWSPRHCYYQYRPISLPSSQHISLCRVGNFGCPLHDILSSMKKACISTWLMCTVTLVHTAPQPHVASLSMILPFHATASVPHDPLTQQCPAAAALISGKRASRLKASIASSLDFHHACAVACLQQPGSRTLLSKAHITSADRD